MLAGRSAKHPEAFSAASVFVHSLRVLLHTNTSAKGEPSSSSLPIAASQRMEHVRLKSESVIAAAQQQRIDQSVSLSVTQPASNASLPTCKSNTLRQQEKVMVFVLAEARAFDCLVACVSRSCPRRERTTGWSVDGALSSRHIGSRVLISRPLLAR